MMMPTMNSATLRDLTARDERNWLTGNWFRPAAEKLVYSVHRTTSEGRDGSNLIDQLARMPSPACFEALVDRDGFGPRNALRDIESNEAIPYTLMGLHRLTEARPDNVVAKRALRLILDCVLGRQVSAQGARGAADVLRQSVNRLIAAQHDAGAPRHVDALAGAVGAALQNEAYAEELYDVRLKGYGQASWLSLVPTALAAVGAVCLGSLVVPMWLAAPVVLLGLMLLMADGLGKQRPWPKARTAPEKTEQRPSEARPEAQYEAPRESIIDEALATA